MLIRKLQVQQIIGKARAHGSTYYLIKWRYKDAQDSTWRNQLVLRNLKDSIAQFNKKTKGVQLPYIADKYQKLLKGKIQSIQEQDKSANRTLEACQKANAKGQKIIGKARAGKNILYLTKWLSEPIQNSSWQQGFIICSKQRRLISQFNRNISQEDLPYLDTVSIKAYNKSGHQEKSLKKSKKQRLTQKKVGKQEQKFLHYLIQSFMQKLRKAQNSIQTKHRDRQAKQHVLMGQNSQYSPSLEKQQSLSGKEQQKLLKHNQEQSMEPGQLLLPSLDETYTKKGEYHQQERSVCKSEDQEQFQLARFPQAQLSNQQGDKCVPEHEKRQTGASSMEGQPDKIISIKFQLKVQGTSKQYEKQNLYRVKYNSGQVRYWTTSQLRKEHKAPMEWIRFLEEHIRGK